MNPTCCPQHLTLRREPGYTFPVGHSWVETELLIEANYGDSGLVIHKDNVENLKVLTVYSVGEIWEGERR